MNDDLDCLAVETLSEKVRTKFVRVDNVFLTEEYKSIADAVENFEVFDDDVWVCSFQKSGTTWTQEMVWGITHNVNLESAKGYINDRFPFLEFTGTIATARLALRDPAVAAESPEWVTRSVEYCAKMPRPRHIKCHLPFNLLPRQIRTGERKPKIVYVARNPKDVCISFYHHSKLLEGYCGTFEQFCELFLGDRVNYGPYWNHVLGFWEKRGTENLLFLRFEDMKADLPSVVRRTIAFLGKSLTEEQIDLLTDHLNFNKMKNNPAVNRERTIAFVRSKVTARDSEPVGKFIRNGNVGQWKEAMSDKMVQRFDKWIEENLKNHPDLVL